MIKFTEKDNNKQFIAIEIKSNEIDKISDSAVIVYSLKKAYSALQQANIIFDDTEILIEIDNNINYGFSLNELKEYIKTITAATITHFSVDTEELAQRYYG